MRHTIKLPRLAEMTDEVIVLEWLCDVGATVEAGNPLMLVETDKVDTEVPSPVGGILVEQLVRPGQEISTGRAIAIVDEKRS